MKARRSTIRDVAQAAGVSMGTVSRVAANSGVVREKTRKKVLAAMHELGYQPNAAARAMRTNRTRTLGFLIPDLRNELFAAVARAAEKVLSDQGYMLFLYSSDRSPEREIGFLNEALQRGMDGLILSLCDETNQEVITAVQNCLVPVVIWDRDVDVDADIVFNEHARPMQTVTEHLLELGHRRIALISAPLEIRPGRERVRGFKHALERSRQSGLQATVHTGRQSADFGYDQVRRLMTSPNPPTAIIAGGNDIFYGVMKALRSLNLRIPQDVSVVGTDDRLVSEIYDPPITVIDRDMEAIGDMLARVLLRRLNGDVQSEKLRLLIDSQVILRSSTANPAG